MRFVSIAVDNIRPQDAHVAISSSFELKDALLWMDNIFDKPESNTAIQAKSNPLAFRQKYLRTRQPSLVAIACDGEKICFIMRAPVFGKAEIVLHYAEDHEELGSHYIVKRTTGIRPKNQIQRDVIRKTPDSIQIIL